MSQNDIVFIDLNEESGFNKLLDYFNEHKDTFKVLSDTGKKQSRDDKHEWLKIQKFFKSGVQGWVGLLENTNGDKFVFKVSKKIDFLTKHELTIMNDLNTISCFCPHFCRGYGEFNTDINPTIKDKKENFFDTTDCTPIQKEVLLMEYIDKASRFQDIIEHVEDDVVIYSTIKQVMGAVLISQRMVKFTHYDLFCSNIMIKECSKDMCMLYILDDENYYFVPTFGYMPVIIDYGFGFSGGMNGDYLYQNMGHTNAGFYSDRFNNIADFKHFLVSIAGDVAHYRSNRKSKKFNNIVKNLFKNYDVNWDKGWTNESGIASSDFVNYRISEILQTHSETFNSKLFTEFSDYCIDLIQTLIVLPLEKQEVLALTTSFCDFLEEFSKIEKEISSPYYNLYILKCVVNIARKIRKHFANKEQRSKVVSYFRKELFHVITTVAKFVKIDDIDCEKLLKGLFKFAMCIEGLMYDNMKEHIRRFEKLKDKLLIKTPEEMLTIVDVNTEDEYEFNEKTKVMVCDCRNDDKCAIFSLTPEQIDELNETDHVSRSFEVFQIYEKLV